MKNTAISITNIGKEYKIGEKVEYGSLRDDITNFVKNGVSRVFSKASDFKKEKNDKSSDYFWSLRNVSFDIKEGEIIGIIGRNGAGKSTLLKIIAGITEPTEGRIDIYGRIGSLLEVGTGFHQELTGRDNIYLNGAILGMRRNEIDRKFDEIVLFSGIEKFIDTPVKYYSSGMRVRLGFSVAAHLEPEILLLDEVLAVGDAAFQEKCLGKIDNIAASDGRTVLFVSHDLSAIRSLCHRTIFLDEGKLVDDGPSEEVVDNYLSSLSRLDEVPLEERNDIYQSHNSSLKATFISFENIDKGKPMRPSNRIKVKIGYKSDQPVKNLIVQIQIKDYASGQPITYLNSDNSGGIPSVMPVEGIIVCITEPTYITSGKCSIDLMLLNGTQLMYKLEHAASFNIEEEVIISIDNLPREQGTFVLKQNWSTQS